MYVSPNFKTKKALKEAVAAGKSVSVFSPGPFPAKTVGTEYIEGPHYPEPHRWYASVTVKGWDGNSSQMTRERKLSGCILSAALGVALGMHDVRAAEASTQSHKPWTIGQCDRLTGRRASAVFNTTVWSGAGWPLWRVVCLY